MNILRILKIVLIGVIVHLNILLENVLILIVDM